MVALCMEYSNGVLWWLFALARAGDFGSADRRGRGFASVVVFGVVVCSSRGSFPLQIIRVHLLTPLLHLPTILLRPL